MFDTIKRLDCIAIVTLLSLAPMANAQDATVGIICIDYATFEAVAKSSDVDVPGSNGAVVLGVMPYSPAALAKLGPYDIITEVDGKKVTSPKEVTTTIRSLTIGEPARFELWKRVPTTNQLRWTKKTIKITPVSERSFVDGCLAAEKDDVTGVTVYKHRDTPGLRTTSCFAYFSEKGAELGDPVLAFQYAGKELLGIQSLTVKAGKKTFTIDPQPLAVKSDFDGRGAWEWYHHRSPTREQVEMADALSMATEATIRFSGINYKSDHEMSPEELARIYVVLRAHKLRSTPMPAGVPKKDLEKPVGDARSGWSNTSYDSTLRHIKDKDWQEFDNKTGKLKSHLKETARTPEYVELRVLERDHLYRVYPKRLDFFKNGKWEWLSNGEWEPADRKATTPNAAPK